MALKTVYIQSYDGVKTSVTTDDGVVLSPVSVTIWMEPESVHRADMTFIAVQTDIKAMADTVTMICPICSHEDSHNCNKEATFG